MRWSSTSNCSPRCESRRLTATAKRVDSWNAAGETVDADVLECSFHARAVATATAAAASSALVASGNADDDAVRAEQSRWYGAADAPRSQRFGEITRQALAQTDLRSVWLRNSLRGAIGFALAVLVAKVTGVQHGFWVVLGTLGVLRSNALGTGAIALRALAGTALGFIVGGILLVGLGNHVTALWIVLPFAVLVAGYAPIRISFLAGQAAFTVLLAVLFNIVQPTGWRVGLVRVEDVAIGCGVSLVVGLLLWPRGAAPVVSLDLADAYRSGVAYLSSAVHTLIGQHSTLGQSAVSETAANPSHRGLAAARFGVPHLPGGTGHQARASRRARRTRRRRESTATGRELTRHAATSSHRRQGHRRPRAADEILLDGELHDLGTSIERIADYLSPTHTWRRSQPEAATLPAPADVPPVTPNSVCARWIHHHLSHLQTTIGPLSAAATVLRDAHGPLAR